MRVLLTILVLALAVVGFHLAAMTNPTPGNWGVNHYGFLSGSWLALGLALLAVAILAGVVLGRTAAAPRLPAPLAGAAVVLLGGVLFWVLREQVHFLGEGTLLVRSLEEGIRLRREAPGEAPGAFLAVFALDRALGDGDPAATMAAISILAGMIYLALSFLFAGTVGVDGPSRVAAFGLPALAGTTRLFYGAVDPNALTAVGVLAYLVLAVRALRPGGNPWPAAVVFVLILPLQLSLAVLIPSVFALFLLGEAPRLRGVPGILAGLAVTAAGAGLAAAAWGGFPGWFGAVRAHFADVIPFGAATDLENGTSLLSPGHLGDVLQSWLLAGPLAILLVLALWVFGAGRGAGRAGGFLLWAAVPWTVFLFLHRIEVGPIRGWSQFAPATLPWLLLAAILFARAREAGEGLRERALAAGVLVGTAAFHLLGTVAVEAAPERGLPRFVAMHGPGSHVSPLARAAAFEEVSEFYKEARDPESAVVALTEAYQADTSSSRLAGNLGALLTVMGRLDEALPVLEEGVRRGPKNEVVRFQLAGAYEAAGRFDDARREMDAAIELNPEFLQAYLRASVIARQQGDLEAAEGYLLAAKERYPQDGDVPSNLGRVYEAMGRHDAAVAAYEEGQRLNPGDTAAAFNLARLYLAAERPADAARTLEGIVTRTPEDVEAWINLGVAYSGLERPGEAARAFEKARTLDATRPEPYFNLARQRLIEGDRDAALELLRAYVSRDSTSDYGLMGRSLIRRIQAEAAAGEGR